MNTSFRIQSQWAARRITASYLKALQLVTLLFCVLLASVAFGRQINITSRITPTGDEHVQTTIRLPEEIYEQVQDNVSPAYMARVLNENKSWAEMRDVHGEFRDADSAFNASLIQVARAFPVRPGKWVIDLSQDGLTLVTITDNTAFFTGVMEWELGPSAVVAKYELPEGCENVRFDETSSLLTYDYEPPLPTTEDAETGFDVDITLMTRDEIMSSVAKIYSDESFDNFWVARTRIVNTSQQPIHNLRIRHRMVGLSTWSSWQRYPIVYPGQTTIAPFFPVLDIKTLAQFTDARTAMVEMEFEFDAGDDHYTDTDSRKTRVLARNQVLWASRQANDRLDWTDNFDNAPMIISAFCNSNDPVVQEIAGVVSRMNGGIPQDTDEGAIGFLQKFWEFLEINRVAYQSPASGADAFGQNLQHVKYSRDVIRNRAGTCVDLAILWASVAKAVGLEPYVYVIPGHAFPVIKLPSGDYLPIESTYILHHDFETAVDKGIESFRIAEGQITTDSNGNPLRDAGQVIVVDVNQLQSAGIHCLDLPPVDDGFLIRLNYNIEGNSAASTVATHTTRKPTTATTPAADNRPLNSHESRLVGTWRMQSQNGVATIVFNSDRSFRLQINQEPELTGQWAADDSQVSLDGDAMRYAIDHQARLNLDTGENVLQFTQIDSPNRPSAAASFVGRWDVSGNFSWGSLQGYQVFHADGKYEAVITWVSDGERSVNEEYGTWVDRGSHFDFDTNLGQYQQRYRVNGHRMDMEFEEIGWLTFQRHQAQSAQTLEQRPPVANANLEGTWSCTVYKVKSGLRATVTFAPNGQYRIRNEQLNQDYLVTSVQVSEGTWQARSDQVVISFPSKNSRVQADYQVKGNTLYLELDGSLLEFTKVS